MPFRKLSSLLVALLWLCTACGEPAAAGKPTLVFAAASLTDSFEALAKEFERQHPGEKLDLHFAGTSQLVVQVREGAAADVFASADMSNMQKLVDAGQTASQPAVFAKNRLAIVTAKGNPKGIHALADLEREDVRVALCGPEVPAGKYAREALGKASVEVQSVSDEPSVKAVVSKVELGEIDAGVVYVTDAASAKDKVAVVEVPDAQNVVATYPIAVLSAGESRATAEAFVAFVRSSEGLRTLQSYGFQAP